MSITSKLHNFCQFLNFSEPQFCHVNWACRNSKQTASDYMDGLFSIWLPNIGERSHEEMNKDLKWAWHSLQLSLRDNWGQLFHLQTKQVHLIVVNHREVTESNLNTTRTQVTNLNTEKKCGFFFFTQKKMSWITLITGWFFLKPIFLSSNRSKISVRSI